MKAEHFEIESRWFDGTIPSPWTQHRAEYTLAWRAFERINQLLEMRTADDPDEYRVVQVVRTVINQDPDAS